MVSGSGEESGVFMDLLDYGSVSESEEGEEDAPRSLIIVESEPFEEGAEEADIETELEEGASEHRAVEEEEEHPTGKERTSSTTREGSEKDSDSESSGGREGKPFKPVFAVKSLLESAPLNLSKILESQESVLGKRRMFLGVSRRKRKKSGVVMAKMLSAAPVTMSERWKRYLQSLEGDFFTSKEARMEDAGRVGKGKTAYNGLVLTADNNSDIKHIFDVKYRTKKSLGQPVGSFDQLRTAAGQFARLYFTSKRRDPSEFYERGKLLESVTDINVHRALLGYFRIRGSHSTVASKSMHLKTLAHGAEVYFSGKDEKLKGMATTVVEFLLSEAASEKMEARRFARARKSTEGRLMHGTLLLPADFIRGIEAAKAQLSGVLSTYRRLERDRGSQKAKSIFQQSGKILQKWNINLIGLLVLSGGGQRPQVFCQLQLPSQAELAENERRSNKLNYVELRTVIEKTTRAFDMPNVVFPSGVFQFIDFQTRVIRPILLKKNKRSEVGLREKTLLVDTRSGDPLRSQQVAHTFQRFLSQIDPELSKITPMALRGSYATMMLQAYRRREIFKNKSEGEFLEFLAKAMNTSVEQLAGTYAGNEMSDFEQCARRLTSILAQTDIDEDPKHREKDQFVNAPKYFWSWTSPILDPPVRNLPGTLASSSFYNFCLAFYVEVET